MFAIMPASAQTIKVAGIYTQPIQQKWDARLHQALVKARDAGEIEYVFSEKVANTDYIRVLREYAESGVKLIVGEAFGRAVSVVHGDPPTAPSRKSDVLPDLVALDPQIIVLAMHHEGDAPTDS